MKVFVDKLLHDLFRMVDISPLRQFAPPGLRLPVPRKMTKRNIYFLFRVIIYRQIKNN